MQDALEHFRTLDRKLDADRAAFNAQTSELSHHINEEAAKLGHIEDDEDACAQVRATVHKLKQERANLRPPSFVNPLKAVEQFAATHANAEPVPVVVKVPNGQTPLAVHNNAAEATTNVLAEIQRVNSAPVNDPEAIARQVDELAKPPRMVGGKLVLPRQIARSATGVATNVVNVEGLLAWLLRDELIAAAKELASDDGPTITAQAKAKALADLYERFAAALRLESAAAIEAEKAGQSVIRRKHVHPAVLLGVSADAKAVYDWHSQRRGA